MGTSKNSSLEPIRLMPFFVFLNLLKGEPEGVGKLRLAHAKHHAPHAKSAADVNVDGAYFRKAPLRASRHSRAVSARKSQAFD